jgi:putative transcriptional regulator
VLEKRLEKIRKLRSISLYALAKGTGVSWQNLKRLERGETSRIDFALLERLCEVLDCQPGDLLQYRKTKRRKNDDESKKT